MVALSVLTVAFLGGFELLSRSLNVNKQASDQVVGLYLAAEGIELVKNLIDANILQRNTWNCGFAAGTFHLSITSVSSGPGTCPGQALDPAGPDRLYYRDARMLYTHNSNPPRVPTRYNRQIIIQFGTNPDEMIVTSHVWMTETTSGGGTTWSVDLEDHFLNWRP